MNEVDESMSVKRGNSGKNAAIRRRIYERTETRTIYYTGIEIKPSSSKNSLSILIYSCSSFSASSSAGESVAEAVFAAVAGAAAEATVAGVAIGTASSFLGVLGSFEAAACCALTAAAKAAAASAAF